MNPQNVVEHFGSIASAAKAIGCSRAAIYLWLAAGEVPYLRQCQIQILTGGALQAAKARD